MEDNIKKFRDNHQVLDFAAGFVPGVGEALDVQDLYHAIKDKDYTNAALALAFLGIPGMTFGLFRKMGKVGDALKDIGGVASKKAIKDTNSDKIFKILDSLPQSARKKFLDWTPYVEQTLSDRLINMGYKLEGNWIINNEGKQFRKVKYGTASKLVPKEEFIEMVGKKIPKIKELNSKKLKTDENLKKLISDFNKKALEFGERTGYKDLHTDLWLSGIPKGLKMNDELLKLYITKGAPVLMDHIDDLYKKGINHDGKSFAVKKEKGIGKDGQIRTKMFVFYPLSLLKLQGELANTYKSGWREVEGDEFEYYLLSTSPNARKNLFLSGMPMFRGIKSSMFKDLKEGSSQGWFTNKYRNTSIYTIDPNSKIKGYLFMAAPVRHDNSYIEYITGALKNRPSSNHWSTSSGKDWIGDHILGNKDSINITDTSVFDDMLSNAERGIWTVLGDANQIKILKGGTGLYDPSFKDPFLKYGGTINKIFGI